jgi:hypothetical protein
VLRHPPYHPDLNPTELIWRRCRTKWVACNNTAFKVKDLENLQKDLVKVSDHAARLTFIISKRAYPKTLLNEIVESRGNWRELSDLSETECLSGVEGLKGG